MNSNPQASPDQSAARVFARFGPRQKTGLILGPLLFALAAGALARAGWRSEESWMAATVMLMATWWITEPIPLWATASLPLILFPAIGVAPWHETVLTYFDPINFFFLGGLLIAAAMQQWGLHRRIALGIVAAIGTSPRRIVLGFMLATGFVTLWISNTATAMMMFPIGMAVLRKFEEQTGPNDPLLRRFGLALMLGIGYAASIGGIGTKIGTGPNLVFVKHAGDLQTDGLLPHDLDFLTWLKVGMPIVMIVLPLVWLYLVRAVAKLPEAGLPGGEQAIVEERSRLGSMQTGERVALMAFLTAAFLWIFRKDIDLGTFILPGWSRLVSFGWEDFVGRPVKSLPDPFPDLLRDTGDALVAMTIGLALLFIPVARKPLRLALEVRSAARISWDLLVLLGGGFAMAYGIQKSGLSESVGGVLKGMGHMDRFAAIWLVCLIATMLTEVASNTATATILLPLLAVTASSFGLHPAPLMFAATLSASFGFMLPAGTPPNAIVFSSGYITVPQMARSGFVVDLAGSLLIAVACYFLAPWALGIR